MGAALHIKVERFPQRRISRKFTRGAVDEGSTSEFSADAPLREPFNLYVHGGTHRAHIRLALSRALCDLNAAGLINLPQTGIT